jgi:predicted metal-dependent phosphoesterase TrpH
MPAALGHSTTSASPPVIERGPLKVELHAHTDLDPLDRVQHSTRQLIDRAASLGYDALAVTLHDRYYDPADDRAYAAGRGVVLLSGIERTIGRSHVLLINFPASCTSTVTFEDVAALKAAHPAGLVIAPHALFPNPSSLGAAALDRHAALFDAVEINALYTRHVNFNARAVTWARAMGKPLVGSSDVHSLPQLGTTFSLVFASPDADAICAAIRAGRVEVRTQPVSLLQAGIHFSRMLIAGAKGRLAKLLGW